MTIEKRLERLERLFEETVIETEVIGEDVEANRLFDIRKKLHDALEGGYGVRVVWETPDAHEGVIGEIDWDNDWFTMHSYLQGKIRGDISGITSVEPTSETTTAESPEDTTAMDIEIPDMTFQAEMIYRAVAADPNTPIMSNPYLMGLTMGATGCAADKVRLDRSDVDDIKSGLEALWLRVHSPEQEDEPAPEQGIEDENPLGITGDRWDTNFLRPPYRVVAVHDDEDHDMAEWTELVNAVHATETDLKLMAVAPELAKAVLSYVNGRAGMLDGIDRDRLIKISKLLKRSGIENVAPWLTDEVD